MPAENRETQIMSFLQTNLAAVAGAAYHYPPQRVRWVDGPDPIDPYFSRADTDDLDTFYLLWAEDERDTLWMTGRQEKLLPVSILLARKVTRLNTEADAPMRSTIEEPQRAKVIDRLLRDFDVATYSFDADRSMGGLCTKWDIAVRNRQIYQEGWDCAQVLIEVAFQHPRATP